MRYGMYSNVATASRSALIALVVVGLASCAQTTPGVFTVILLPDTQNYAEKFPDTYVAQAEWIRERQRPDNVQFVIHLGDIVQNAMVEAEWENADRAHALLDGIVPYSITPGNHDLDLDETGDLTRGTIMFDRYFGPDRFIDQPWYGGHLGESNANNFCRFEVSGLKFLVLSLEWAPQDATIEWASQVLQAHKDHRVILATHYYMRTQGRGHGDSLGGHIGDDLWERFVRKHENIFMVVSGHVSGVYHQSSKNDAGHDVHEILCDYQNLENGGDGWLQTLRFVPKTDEIYVDAYSPVVEKTNRQPKHTYVIPYPMTGRSLKSR